MRRIWKISTRVLILVYEYIPKITDKKILRRAT